jgi:hypothetical protein
MLGSKLICEWLEERNLCGSYGEQIIEEARTKMMLAEMAGKLPNVDPPNNPAEPTVIIERCKPQEPLDSKPQEPLDSKPQEPLDDTPTFIAWYAKWLARWVVFAITDPDARDQALDLALQTQYPR